MARSKTLIFEFVCGGGCYRYTNFGSPIDASNNSMLREGAGMLDAVVKKYLANGDDRILLVPMDAQLLSAIDSSASIFAADADSLSVFQWIDHERVQLACVSSIVELNKVVTGKSLCFDSAIVIAPEIENALFEFTREVENIGVKLLSPNSNVIEIGSDKWRTYCHLIKHKIPTPKTCLGPNLTEEFSGISIVKPRFGAGSMDVKKISPDQVGGYILDSDCLIQEFVEGLPGSIAIDCDQDSGFSRVFPLMRQVFARDSFRYIRSEKIVDDELHFRAEKLLRQVVASLPAFNGYLGIDIVLGAKPEFDRVIEINPRYTSSFCFLS